ncbi:MAG: HlyD family efflux transporter periplasmic adaptor subunit [Bacillota bacterium]
MGAAIRRVFRPKKLHQIAIWALLLSSLYYFVGLIANREPSVVFSSHGILEKKQKATVLWIRREKVYIAPIKGICHLAVREGEKVPKGAVLGLIKAKEDFSQSYQEIIADIAERRKQIRKQRTHLSIAYQQKKLSLMLEITNLEKSVFKETDGQTGIPIKQRIENLKRNLQGTEVSYRTSCRELEKKMAVLQAEEERYYRKSKKNLYVCRALEHGVVSYHVDGLEAAFAYENITPESRLWFHKAPRSRVFRPRQEVREGDPLYKIVTNDRIYGMALLPNAILVELEKGRRIFFMKNGFPWWAEVVAKYEGSGRRPGFMVFECCDFPDFLMAPRREVLELVLASYNGTVIPGRALVTVHGKPGVYLVSVWRKKRFIPVEILGRVGNSVAVKGIPEGRRVIVQ